MSFSQHFLTKATPCVRDACGVLYDQYDISCFAMDITFAGGQFSMLTDQPDFLEPYYYRDLTLSCVDRFGRALPDGVYTDRMLRALNADQQQKVESYLNSRLKTMQYLLIVESHANHQVLGCFGFNMSEIAFDFLLTNHLQEFKQFLKYFQKHELAMQAKQPEHRLFCPEVSQLELDRSRYQNLLTPQQLPKETQGHFSNLAMLPPQQQTCLNHLLKGLSAKQIAYEMQLSVRTIDAYLAIIRKKTGCRNAFELLKRFT